MTKVSGIVQFPKISVVTPTYNQADFIDDCIRSVINQDYPNYEHIVIDGASTDGTVDKLKQYGHLTWKSEKDNGQSEALNKALKMATGDIIAWINSDDWYPKGAFAKVGRYFQNHPDNRILIGDCLFYHEGAAERNLIVHNQPFSFEDIIRYWDEWIPPTQPAIFFRRELLDEVGYFDEGLHYAMDYDFWLRVSQGNDFAYISELLAAYRLHDQSKSGNGVQWNQFYPEWHKVYQRHKSYSASFSKTSPLISIIIKAEITVGHSSQEVNSNLKQLISTITDQIVQDLEIIILTNQPNQLKVHSNNASIPVHLLLLDSFNEKSIQNLINREAKGKIIEQLSLTQKQVRPDHYINLIDNYFPAKKVRAGLIDSQKYPDLLPPSGNNSGLPFSVIIPTHNRAATLKKCLEALSNQTFSSDRFEVIVCDDGSSDNTEEVVRNYRTSYHLSYVHQKNAGPAAARNKGLKIARGRFVLFINDDTILDESALERHYETHLAHPGERISVLGTFDFPEEYRQSLLVRLINENGLLFEYNKMHPGGYYDYNFFYTCNLSVPRQAVLDVGMFDEVFEGPAAEDIDLGFRLHKKGYRLIYQPACLSIHDHPVTLDGFCKTHRIRGYGHMTLVTRHPELNYWKNAKQKEILQWVSHWKKQEPVVEKLLAQLKETGVLLQDEPKGIKREELAGVLVLLKNYFEAVGKMSHPYFTQRQTDPEVVSPLVSVIIPCHNYGRFLRGCVESVTAQTYQNLEVFIVDDGSFDDTAEVAESLSHQYPQVSVITQRNSGQPAIARNNGITAAKGDYILCLDADDRISPEFIENTVCCLEQNPEAAIAYPDQQNFGDRTDFEPHPEYSFRNLVRFNFIPPASLFRRKAWEAVGGFATNVIGYEDWDFWVSCAEKGYTGRHVPEAVWHYRVHNDGLYQSQISKDQRLKARVVMNHPRLYTQAQKKWAKGVLTGNTEALGITGGIGMVPQFDNALETPQVDRQRSNIGDSGRESRHILFTMYGWDDEGGGTILPRQIAKELVRRGNRVSVIYTPSKNLPDKPAYYLEQSEDDGVQLFAVYNRPALFYDVNHPEREISDPKMRELVGGIIAELKPDIIHYHSFLNFSMGVAKDVHEAGIPSVYTSHNYWPLCPRMYLFDDKLNLCSGPSADGSKCAACVKNNDQKDGYAARAEEGRRMLGEYVDRHLAVSNRVKELFVANGHREDRIHVLQQQPETADRIWRTVGVKREIVEDLNRPLRIGFIGSLLLQKGVHLLVQALQAFSRERLEGFVFGGGPEPVVKWLKTLDKKNLVTFTGKYELNELPDLLKKIDVMVVPSVWEDCAPLVVSEGLAARLPVIGARMGGIPDFIEEGTTGFLFSYNDVQELAQKIGGFISDRKLLGRMQRNIRYTRSFGDYMDDLLRHYNEVMDSNETRRSPQQEKRGVIIEGSQFVNHSLARVNREIGKQLIRREYSLSILPYEKDTWIPEKGTDEYALYEHYRAPVPSGNHVHIRHRWPPDFTPPASGHWVIIQPWEFGSLPEKWIRPMSDLVDEVWVPSHYVKECYVRSGVPDDQVQVVPNGVDTEMFTPKAKPYPLHTKKSFKFLFVGGTIARKGIDVLLNAYARNFTAKDDVCLVIKDMGGSSFYRGQTAADTITRLQTHPDAPEIEYIDEELSDEEIAGLYTACNCLVHPYRGEGFGLPIAEAMAAGLPVIVTGCGAALDFCNDDNAWLIKAREMKLKEKAIGSLKTVDHPWWAEPNPESLVQLMKYVIQHPEEVQKKAKKARKTILTRFTWDNVGDCVARRINELSGKPIRRLQPAMTPKWTNKESFIRHFMQRVQRQEWNPLMEETEKVCRQYPDDTYLWVLRSIALRMNACFDDAIEAVQHSLRINETPEALYETIQLAGVMNKPEQAQAVTHRLQSNYPDWWRQMASQAEVEQR